jgi:CPA2 family monovalent cation:H+ antiporter-2
MGYFMGLPVSVSLIFGMIISLSSTMVVLKVLMNRGLIGTLSSKVMIGMLIVQDLAAIPLMIVIPQLQNIEGNLPVIGFTILKAFIVLFIIIMVGIRLIPFVLKYVAKLNSRELFLITITAIGLGIGYVTHIFGLSLAFGAFVAGMVISESDYSHQALNDIIPLRDIFGLVFFTSIGMLIDPVFVSANLMKIIILVVLIAAGKFIIFYSLAMIFMYRNIVPLALGLGLAQIGEFSFVLARTAVHGGVIDKDFYSLVLSVSVITMILSPFLSMLSTPLYSLKRKWFKHEPVQTINMPDGGLTGHVIIAGGGRVGSHISAVLRRLNFQSIIIEQDFRKFEIVKKEGFPVIYGDAGQETVLSAADIHKARLLIITAPSLITAREILSVVGRHNPDMDVIVRANDLDQIKDLQALNVNEIVQPEFEASLEIIRQALLHLDCRLSGIQNIIDEMRHEIYASGRNSGLYMSMLSKLKDTPFLLETGWYEIKPENIFNGKSSRDLEVRTRTGVSIVGLMRDGEFTPNPGPEVVFESEDIIAVIGIPEKRRIFENLFFKEDLISNKEKCSL